MNLGLFLFSCSWLVKEHFGPWLSFHSESLAFAGLAAMLTFCLIKSKGVLPVPSIVWVVVLTVFIPPLQFFFGTTYFAGDAFIGAFYQVGLFCSILIGYSALKADDRSRSLIPITFSIALPALISAAIGWIQWFNVDDYYLSFAMLSPSGVAVGNLAQPNLLATLLIMGIVAVTFLLHLRILAFGTFLLAVSFMSVAVAMTQSRAALVSAFAVTAFITMRKKFCPSEISIPIIWGWLAALIGARWGVSWLGDLLLLPGGNGVMSLTNANGRLEIWAQVADAIVQAPWTGYGWNQTFRAQVVGAVSSPADITYTYAHNFVLDMLAWNGIPLGISIVAAVAYWLVSRMRMAYSPSSIFAIGSVLPILAHSLFEFPFAYANFLLTAGLLIGVIEANHVTTRRFVVRAKVFAVLGAVYLIVGVMAALEYVRVEEDYRIVRFENLRIGDTPSDYEVPHLQLLTHMGAMLDAARTAPAPGMSAAQIENLREASHRFPYGLLMYKYAVARALNGDQEGGIRQMQALNAIYGEKYYGQSKEAFHLATQLQVP
jgi:O-antigen ligase